jgi:flagellar biosynthetic protein FliR
VVGVELMRVGLLRIGTVALSADPGGFQLAVGESTIAGFLMAVSRTAGFVLITPPFNSRSVPAQARVGLSIALALPLSAVMRAGAPSLASTDLVLQIVAQAFMGVTLGFFVLVALSTIQAVGDLLDTVGGFSAAMALDPMLFIQTSIMGRLHQITAVTLLFATGGHLVVLQGLARSVQTMPRVSLDWQSLAHAVVDDVSGMFLAAVQITAPVIAAMLIADVALGLLTRAAPALNAFSLGFPLKILFTLLLAGLIVARLPQVLNQLVEHAALTGVEISTPRPTLTPAPLPLPLPQPLPSFGGR